MRDQAAPGSSACFSFESKNPAQEKELFFAELRKFARSKEWPASIENEVELIFEEWLTNVVSHGLAQQTKPEVHVSIETQPGRARIEILDNGILFDPTQQPEPDLSRLPEERPAGGLGIFMMRRLSSGMRYERKTDWNRLVIEKDLLNPSLVKPRR